MDFTGERMVPEKAGDATFWEHIYRYRFATQYVRHKRVLDIACGEGYGTAALFHAGAKQVIGIDISADACRHARKKYGIDARTGDALHIPIPSQSIDIIVSFETIEHLGDPAAFLNECKRVLASQGQLIISTPNREIYSRHGQRNPFHHNELDITEFTSLLRQRFRISKIFTQCPTIAKRTSIRSLAASNTQWVHTRGFWRLRKLLRDFSCAHLWDEVKSNNRNNPVHTILSQDPPLAKLVNPYAVRPWARRHREQPMYVIAVASL